MKASNKAVLLSAFIFPGIGHLSMGYKKMGWSIIAANIFVLYLMIREIIVTALKTVEKIQNSGAMADAEAISKLTSDMVGFSDNTFLNTLLLLLIVGWFFAVFDVYRLGKK